MVVDACQFAPQQVLYFLPLPHEHKSLRPVVDEVFPTVSVSILSGVINAALVALSNLRISSMHPGILF